MTSNCATFQQKTLLRWDLLFFPSMLFWVNKVLKQQVMDFSQNYCMKDSDGKIEVDGVYQFTKWVIS